MPISPTKYKLQIREYINGSLTFDFKILISIIPVLFGIYKILYLKYGGSFSNPSLLLDDFPVNQSIGTLGNNFSKIQTDADIMHIQNRDYNSEIPIGTFPSNQSFLVHEKLISSCFKKNLPGVDSESTKISWQTFQEIFYDQLNFESLTVPSEKTRFFNYSFGKNNNNNSVNSPGGSFSKKVDVYNDSVKINTNLNWFNKQKKLYVGILNTTESSKDNFSYQIGNNWSSIFAKKFLQNPRVNNSYLSNQAILLSNKNNSNVTKNAQSVKPIHFTTGLWNFDTFINLDELPIKLNSVYTETQKNVAGTSASNDPITENLLIPFESKSNASNKKLQFDVLNKKKITVSGCSKKPLQAAFEKAQAKAAKLEGTQGKRGKELPPQPTEKLNKNFLITKQSKSSVHASKFIPIKIYNFSEFFPDRKTIDVGKTNKNINIFLKGVVLDTERCNVDVLENSTTLTSKAPFLKSPFRPTSLEKFTKNNHLENVIKQYSLNNGLTPLANYEITNTDDLNKNSINIENYSTINTEDKKISNKNDSFVSTSGLTESGDDTSLDQNTGVGSSGLTESEDDTSLDQNTKVQSSDLIKAAEFLELIEDFISLDKNNEISPRIMSGYIIPDISNKNHLSELKKLNKIPINVDILKNCSNSIELFNLKNIDGFSFKRGSVDYPPKPEQPFYSGASVYINNITNELEINNLPQGKNQVDEFIYSDNPLTDRQHNFFGNLSNEVARKGENETIKATQKNEMSIKSPLFFKNKKNEYEKIFTPRLYPREHCETDKQDQTPYESVTTSNHNPTFSKTGSEYIIYFNGEEWKMFFNKLKTSNLLYIFNKKTQKYELNKEIFFPSDSFYQPNNPSILWPLNQLDYKPNSQTQVLPAKFLFSNVYKRKYTIYKNQKLPALTSSTGISSIPINKEKFNNLLLFYESSEPITSDSWLFVTQFSIGFLLLNIIQKILQIYEKELKYSISILTGNKDLNLEQPDSDENNEKLNVRIIKNITKNFDNVAGIDVILPELGEIICFFKNPKRYFTPKETIPQGILLTGPPGTGKTLLIQAIAGEAEVPVLIESASSLTQPESALQGPEKLKKLFDKAREIAPCIVFIDEIDSFGEARGKMMENPLLNNPIIDSIYPNNQRSQNSSTLLTNFNSSLNPKILNSSTRETFQDSSNNLFSDKSQMQPENTSKQEKLNLLIQFLVELDGISTEKKVLVFGATNRPQVLDSALTRPGRFNKTLNLKLPNKQKRIEIIKLYTKNIGVEKTISWEYLANLTIGLTAADLASAINQSSIQAIQAETIHTIETIEHGIEVLTGYSNEKNKLQSVTNFSSKTLHSGGADPLGLHFKNVEPSFFPGYFVENLNKKVQHHKNLINKSNFKKFLFINRLAYYQAGKVVVQTLLKKHPAIISIRLWPELKSQRHHLVNGILEKNFSQIYRRVELESRIIGFYGGKAGECLGLFATLNKQSQQTTTLSSDYLKQFLYTGQSDIGIQDISFASWLAELMVNKWYLYSKKISVQNFNQLQENSNLEKNSYIAKIKFLEKKSIYIKNKINRKEDLIPKNSQNFITKPWLQQQIIKKLEFSYSNKNDWYKIYGGDHEENENTQYLSPDIYCHTNLYLENLNDYDFKSTKILLKKQRKRFSKKQFSIVNWNDVANLNRDYIYHNLILICFNKAISILDKNRELLDLFSTSLIQKEILREYEINDMVQAFYNNFSGYDTILNYTNLSTKNDPVKNNNIILEKSWGSNSHKKLLRFINLRNLK